MRFSIPPDVNRWRSTLALASGGGRSPADESARARVDYRLDVDASVSILSAVLSNEAAAAFALLSFESAASDGDGRSPKLMSNARCSRSRSLSRSRSRSASSADGAGESRVPSTPRLRSELWYKP